MGRECERCLLSWVVRQQAGAQGGGEEELRNNLRGEAPLEEPQSQWEASLTYFCSLSFPPLTPFWESLSVVLKFVKILRPFFSHLLSRSSPSITNIVHLTFLRSIILFYTWIFAPWEKLYQCQRVAAWKGRCTIYLWQIRIWKEKTANKLKYINSTILSNWNMQIWKPGIVTENY